MNAKQFALAGVGLLSLALAIGATSRENREEVGHSWRRLIGDPGQACFDYQRLQLKDPYSARFESYTKDPTTTSTVGVTYYAKNGYGAYVRGEALCSVSGGKVSEMSTDLVRSIKADREERKVLQRQIDCSIRKVTLINAGRSAAEVKELADC